MADAAVPETDHPIAQDPDATARQLKNRINHPTSSEVKE
jgi:hypothetical protein